MIRGSECSKGILTLKNKGLMISGRHTYLICAKELTWHVKDSQGCYLTHTTFLNKN